MVNSCAVFTWSVKVCVSVKVSLRLLIAFFINRLKHKAYLLTYPRGRFFFNNTSWSILLSTEMCRRWRFLKFICKKFTVSRYVCYCGTSMRWVHSSYHVYYKYSFTRQHLFASLINYEHKKKIQLAALKNLKVQTSAPRSLSCARKSNITASTLTITNCWTPETPGKM